MYFKSTNWHFSSVLFSTSKFLSNLKMEKNKIYYTTTDRIKSNSKIIVHSTLIKHIV